MIFETMLNAIFGCRHARLSRVFTDRGKILGTGGKNSRVICFDCGLSFEYDWTTMRIGRRVIGDQEPATWEQAAARQASASAD